MCDIFVIFAYPITECVNDNAQLGHLGYLPHFYIYSIMCTIAMCTTFAVSFNVFPPKSACTTLHFNLFNCYASHSSAGCGCKGDNLGR